MIFSEGPMADERKLNGSPSINQEHYYYYHNTVGNLRHREIACSASGSNFKSCVWMAVLCDSSHHPQDSLLAQFTLRVYKAGIKPHSFHFLSPMLHHFCYIKHQNIYISSCIHLIADSVWWGASVTERWCAWKFRILCDLCP